MNLDDLSKRLNEALVSKSLRVVAANCNVSHELIRKLALSAKGANLTVASYNKIDAGLRANGF